MLLIFISSWQDPVLGISLHSGVSYPVGKVEELRLYPMNFIEFLDAMGKAKLASILKEGNWTSSIYWKQN